MCRWIFLQSSQDVQLSDVILHPKNSMVHQSFNATFHPGFCNRNNATLNADGFGLGWYHSCSHLPALFKAVEPAWNDSNLREICMSTRSNCFLAHVRAASLGSVVSRENCHPFKFGRLLFCHNGHVEQFNDIKREIHAGLTKVAYNSILGTTDSETLFAMIISSLEDADRTDAFQPQELVNALQLMISQIRELIEKNNIVDGFTTLNCCLTDGNTVVVSRFCDKYPTIPPPSLYYAFTDGATMSSELVASPQTLSPSTSAATPGDGTNKTNNGAALPAPPQPSLPPVPISNDPGINLINDVVNIVIDVNASDAYNTTSTIEALSPSPVEKPLPLSTTPLKTTTTTTSDNQQSPNKGSSAKGELNEVEGSVTYNNSTTAASNYKLSPSLSPASFYNSTKDGYVRGVSNMVLDRNDYGFVVASSPLTDSCKWHAISSSTILYCERGSKPRCLAVGDVLEKEEKRVLLPHPSLLTSISSDGDEA
jgi:glutamine amidotransferase